MSIIPTFGYNSDMFLVGIINWWYGQGWQRQFQKLDEGLGRTARFFSVGQLLGTLFAPYRQISAAQVQGPIGVQFRAFFDRTFSRLVGAIVRLVTIVAAGIVLFLQALYGFIVALVWPVVPLFPVAGLILAVIGWVPSWM